MKLAHGILKSTGSSWIVSIYFDAKEAFETKTTNVRQSRQEKRAAWNGFVARRLPQCGVTEATMNKAMDYRNHAAEYRHYADECQRLAQQTQDAPIKDGFLALANYWQRLFEKANGKHKQKKPNRS